ncbi:MAG: hypothetical protein R3F62_15275 [Planctomycetota bacterium]
MKLFARLAPLVLIAILVQKLLELRWPKLRLEPLPGPRRTLLIFALEAPRGDGLWTDEAPRTTQGFSDRPLAWRVPPGSYWLYAVETGDLDTTLPLRELCRAAGDQLRDAELRFRTDPDALLELPGNPRRAGG